MHSFLYYLNLKQFLATAATLALVVPAVKAETNLVLNFYRGNGGGNDSSSVVIPVNSIAQCNEEGEKAKEQNRKYFNTVYWCVDGR